MLLLLKGGTNISDPRRRSILAIGNRNLPPCAGLGAVASASLGYAAVQLLPGAQPRPPRAWSPTRSSVVAVRVGALAVLARRWPSTCSTRSAAATPLIVSLKGVPIVVPIIVVLLVVWTFVLQPHRVRPAHLRRRRQPEAARRAGINVDRIRISAFVICSSMAAVGGIIAASPGQLGRPEHRRQQRAALRGRRRGHRRHQPLRRQGPGARRGARRRGGRGHRQRHGPDGLQRRRQVHRDRRRCCCWRPASTRCPAQARRRPARDCADGAPDARRRPARRRSAGTTSARCCGTCTCAGRPPGPN